MGTQFIVENAGAMYPKIDQTYHFDQTENRSVPCPPTAENAAYELNFTLTKEAAEPLLEAMRADWAEFKKVNPKAEMKNKPYKETDDGQLMFKAKLKGAYSGQPTSKPSVYNANNERITDEDFQLTTGSVVNVAVQLVPYATAMAAGVSLRLRAVQVIELNETGGGVSPFGAPKTPFSEEKKAATDEFMGGGAMTQEQKAQTANAADPWSDEIPF